ncbi:MAG: hypothetical protein ACI9G1_004903, partial [Pirellulaceae bacterium]
MSREPRGVGVGELRDRGMGFQRFQLILAVVSRDSIFGLLPHV